MSEVVIPGGRDVRATLDEPADGAVGDGNGDADDGDAEPTAIVVTCPPHPRHGGRRSDGRLVAASDALTDHGVACLRLDYGPWDDGHGEREDVRNAIRWAADRASRVGVFGYSFGAGEAILAAATVDRPDALAGVAALAPPARLGPELAVEEALAAIDARSLPIRVLVGTRDSTVDWEPVADRVSRLPTGEVVELSADHFFLGKQPAIADAVAEFFAEALAEL